MPRKLGRGHACQALPGRIFLVSLAKNPESPAWPGFARLAGFLTGLLMQGVHCESTAFNRESRDRKNSFVELVLTCNPTKY